MKTLVISCLLLAATPAFAGGYKCSGEGVTVELSEDLATLTVTTARQTKSYPVIRTESRSGDVDETYETAEKINLTIDDQYGDSLSLRGKRIKLTCGGL